MDIKEALELVDHLISDHTGKHLSDLERHVFLGSCHGQTYGKIYPSNPEYIEKSVGYKFWQKLSSALGEKVTKKQFRGALERAWLRHSPATNGLPAPIAHQERPIQRVFISHRYQEPDCQLAHELGMAIANASHQVLTADLPYRSGADWLTQMDSCLRQCDYSVLLLSPQAAVSEMVIEELRRVRELQESNTSGKPVILPVQLNLFDMPLNHDLQTYLRHTQSLMWQSSEDTGAIASRLLDILNEQETASSTKGTEPLSRTSLLKREELKEEELKTEELKTEELKREKLKREELKIEELKQEKLKREESKREELKTEELNAHLSSSNSLLPTPVADPELPQGQVRLASRFYVERIPYEAQCYREIKQPGTLIRIKAPRQMGKTSLMSRILHQAREQGCRTVPLSFQHADKAVFESLDQLLQWFCTRIARKLHPSQSVEQYWSNTYGSKDNCTAYFEDCLLPEIDTPLVLGLDEVDRVFQHPKIADDFFGLLRAWYEEASYGDSDSSLWEKLRLVVVHSTEVYIPLDVNQSPFNVGLPIELSEFTSSQVHDLAKRHGLDWHLSQVEHLMQIVGGHPYLVRVALYHITQNALTLNQLIETAPTEAGIYGDHLRRHLWNLQQHPELATAFRRVVTTDHPVELASVLAFKLHSLGLVQLQGNEVTPRFSLYQQYFSDRFGSLEF